MTPSNGAKLPLIIEDRPIDFALGSAPLQLPRGGAFCDYEQPGAVTFFLTAPEKITAHVVGDFNGWDSHATPMETDGRGSFWVTVPMRGATLYRFVVTQDEAGQQRVSVADPYAREVRWDQAGPKAFLGDDPAYTWNDQLWQRPSLRELVIYEVCVRDFTGTKRSGLDQYGDFDGVRARLDHLARLGVNAIELMPISEFPGDSSWGYNPVFYMAPKWLYGRPAQLKALIDEAHQRGIAVILDMVFNHAWADHPYHRMYLPLHTSDGKPLPDRNPFFHHPENGHANSWGGVDWDHGSPYTLAYMQDVVRFWLEEYHVDGFRFDWVGGVEWDPLQPQREGFDPYYGIAPIARAARETAPTCYLIGEYWPISGAHPGKTAARLVHETDIDAVWNGEFHHTLERCLTQTWQWERQDLPFGLGGLTRQGFTAADQVINFLVSHDERRPEHEIQFWGQHIQLANKEDAQRYPTRWDLALQKARLGLVALTTLPGVPMLLAGQEFGEDCERTIAFWPLDWGKLDLSQGRAQFEFCQRLLRLRREHPALRADFVEFYWDDFPRFKVLRYKRWGGEQDVVVVGLNFDNVSQRVGLGFPQDGRWLDVLSGETVVVKGHWHDFVTPPWQAVVLVPA
jgi:1,4-alpha-glucan branching enzyme